MNNIIYGLSRAMAWFGAFVLTLIALMSVLYLATSSWSRPAPHWPCSASCPGAT
jgi:hypothetical protein